MEQVIVDFDLDNGTFSFIDATEFIETFSDSKSKDDITDMFLHFGSFYGLTKYETLSVELFQKYSK